MFKISSLNKNNLNDWLKIANNCPYAWIDILEKNIDKNEKNNFNYLIYQGSEPVAIFSASKIIKDNIFKYFNLLDCNYNGIFIDKNNLFNYKKILEFINQKFLPFILKKHNLHLIRCFSPPLVFLNNNKYQKYQILWNRKLSINDQKILTIYYNNTICWFRTAA